MTEVLIVMAATLFVFLFLLVVLYIRDQRTQKKNHVHSCASCNCHRKDGITDGHATVKDGQKP